MSRITTFFSSLYYIVGLVMVIGISVAVYLDSPSPRYAAQNSDSAETATDTTDLSDSPPAVNAHIESAP